MAKTPTQDDLQKLVNREVILCVSSLVYTLANSGGPAMTDDLANLVEQAVELSYPLDDYEDAAMEAGWIPYTDKFGVACWRDTNDNATWAGTAEDLCREHDIDPYPYQREVFEHWAVSSWLAEKLLAQGEKVDTNFAGMNVWARTTTGQTIMLDSVIERIWIDLHKDDRE